jgi:hypothetical protein
MADTARIGDKYNEWSDETPSLETILTLISIYWFTDCYPSSIYIYRYVSRVELELQCFFPCDIGSLVPAMNNAKDRCIGRVLIDVGIRSEETRAGKRSPDQHPDGVLGLPGRAGTYACPLGGCAEQSGLVQGAHRGRSGVKLRGRGTGEEEIGRRHTDTGFELMCFREATLRPSKSPNLCGLISKTSSRLLGPRGRRERTRDRRCKSTRTGSGIFKRVSGKRAVNGRTCMREVSDYERWSMKGREQSDFSF